MFDDQCMVQSVEIYITILMSDQGLKVNHDYIEPDGTALSSASTYIIQLRPQYEVYY